jgi:hypothetical protein
MGYKPTAIQAYRQLITNEQRHEQNGFQQNCNNK